jgi:hypothetical protein
MLPIVAGSAGVLPVEIGGPMIWNSGYAAAGGGLDIALPHRGEGVEGLGWESRPHHPQPWNNRSSLRGRSWFLGLLGEQKVSRAHNERDCQPDPRHLPNHPLHPYPLFQ